MVLGRICRVIGLNLIVLCSACQPAYSIDNIRVVYPSVNASVMSLMMANKEGYFKEEGINVEFLSIRGEIAIRTTLAGEIDFFTNAGRAMAAVARNVQRSIIATWFSFEAGEQNLAPFLFFQLPCWRF